MITGRELIMYILENKLEDKPISLDGGFLDLMTVEHAAVKAGVGVETVIAGIALGLFRGIAVGEKIYILPQRSNKR